MAIADIRKSEPFFVKTDVSREVSVRACVRAVVAHNEAEAYIGDDIQRGGGLLPGGATHPAGGSGWGSPL